MLVGAASAATGRFVLASATRRLGGRILVERRSALEVARDRVTAHRVGSIAGLGLFALSPLPSGQLFVAAGLFALPLVPVTAAFFAGRIVSYAAYVTAASAVDKSSTERALNAFKSPTGIAVQVLLLAGLGVAPLLLGRRPRSSGRDTVS